jgi:hypothetical protein
VGPINYGGQLSLALDKELVKDRIFAAFNAVYDPEVSRAPGARVRESMLAFSVAMTTQISPGVFVGGEARYMRKYDGVDLEYPLGPGLLCRPLGLLAGLQEVRDLGRLERPGRRPRNGCACYARSRQIHPPAGVASHRIQLLSGNRRRRIWTPAPGTFVPLPRSRYDFFI